jgi:hypothetical protein
MLVSFYLRRLVIDRQLSQSLAPPCDMGVWAPTGRIPIRHIAAIAG